MNAIQKHHIVDLFVWVDDSPPKQAVKVGRKPILTDSELITILLWDRLTEPHKNPKATYAWIEREYHDCFPVFLSYKKLSDAYASVALAAHLAVTIYPCEQCTISLC